MYVTIYQKFLKAGLKNWDHENPSKPQQTDEASDLKLFAP
jgi:hypothetical protein